MSRDLYDAQLEQARADWAAETVPQLMLSHDLVEVNMDEEGLLVTHRSGKDQRVPWPERLADPKPPQEQA